jgi:hypothetical protein
MHAKRKGIAKVLHFGLLGVLQGLLFWSLRCRQSPFWALSDQ